MRIGLVGPTYPFKGGIAQHTTVLAHRLAEAGHDVQLVSWRRQYPKLLYPGQQTVDRPELPPFEPTSRILSWNRPDTWWRAGRRVRGVDLLIFVHVVPAQAIAYRTILGGVGRKCRPAVLALCHNVLPHERRAIDTALVRWLFRGVDRVLVHSASEAREAQRLTERPIRLAELPPHVPESSLGDGPEPGVHRRLLFFGLVREYKGVDLLLRALAQGPPGVRLRIAGEFWGQLDDLQALARGLGIAQRVEFRPGYVAAAEVPALFSDVDAQVLPYRASSASQAVLMAFRAGLPVIVTRIGNLADHVMDGMNGLVVDADSVVQLSEALWKFYEVDTPERLRRAVAAIDDDQLWDDYLRAALR